MWGSESQTEWGQTGGSCLLPGPSLLALEMLQEMPRRAQLLCDLLSGTWRPFSNWPPPTLGISHGIRQSRGPAWAIMWAFWHLPPTPYPTSQPALLPPSQPHRPPGFTLTPQAYFHLRAFALTVTSSQDTLASKLSDESGPCPTSPSLSLCFISPHGVYHPQHMLCAT